MRLEDVPMDVLDRLYHDETFNDLTAQLSCLLRTYGPVMQTAALASVISFAIGHSAADLEETFNLAREFCESRAAEFSSGNCQTLDNPPKA